MAGLRIVEGVPRVGDSHIALVASQFNEFIIDRLLQGAVIRRVSQHFEDAAAKSAGKLALVASELASPKRKPGG